MPSTTTSQPDGNGGTITSTVTKDASGKVTSIETKHTDRDGKEVSNDVETRDYDANGRLREVIRSSRSSDGRRRTEKTTYKDGKTDSVTVRESTGGQTTKYSHTGYRDGKPSTGYREEYDPPGTLRRRIREVYDQDGNIRQRTAIEYDANGRETDRREESFGANGALICATESLITANAGGVPVYITETVYEADGEPRTRVYRTADRAGKNWSSVALAYSNGEVVILGQEKSRARPASREKPAPSNGSGKRKQPVSEQRAAS